MNERQWRKSSHSGSVHNCVEVALSSDAAAVRDSKNPDGGILAFDARRWLSFLSAVKVDRYER
ncbi:DUF397 domain-containing protein [Saccharopolyspora shandongensis]|uniref:DUF397 domain-containing protein n=1 Tax=Saccharopolyspora shandongensis TaxID=418495 RepID=A0A1H3F6I0_9PSEU|nr:DUF397 domain-containing protein [Saccharopolyspora shandongensis]SDX86581.1 protein of unknown function [Saccharopolyspora shandongensis]